MSTAIKKHSGMIGATLVSLFFIFVMSGVFFQSFAYAQSTSGGSPTPGSGPISGGKDTPSASAKLVNPLGAKSVTEFLTQILDIVIIFALPIVIFFIIYAGFKFVTAQGDPAKITEAKNALTWAVVGGVIVLGAEVLVKVIEGTIEAFKAKP